MPAASQQRAYAPMISSQLAPPPIGPRRGAASSNPFSGLRVLVITADDAQRVAARRGRGFSANGRRNEFSTCLVSRGPRRVTIIQLPVRAEASPEARRVTPSTTADGSSSGAAAVSASTTARVRNASAAASKFHKTRAFRSKWGGLEGRQGQLHAARRAGEPKGRRKFVGGEALARVLEKRAAHG